MANAALLADYLFLQALLVARVEAQALQPALRVRPIEDLRQVLDANLPQDTVFVLWDGERFPDATSNGASTMVEQVYCLLLAKRNASQAANARNESAGPLLSGLHRAVAGWAPEGAHRPFRRTTGRLRPDYRAGVALYPLTFSISLNL